MKQRKEAKIVERGLHKPYEAGDYSQPSKEAGITIHDWRLSKSSFNDIMLRSRNLKRIWTLK